MTLPTFTSARDEIMGLFYTQWEAESPAVNGGTAPRVEWPGTPRPTEPDPDLPWARIVVRHSTSRQATLGPAGERRFERTGLVTVQIFAPLTAGGGLSLAENLAIIARDAFEGKGTASGIWFRNARIQEIGPDRTWYVFNTVVEFRYDELR